ncbi:unnamed protein product [Meloidogyne enterolobii]|uniref:Uncharacterized protein n=1 Tax=Meloidogyne enterolobii TaxID=390850 RepID=A0ACB1B692_MELEN
MKLLESKALIFLFVVGLNLLNNSECSFFNFFGNKPKCTEGACPSGSKDVTCKGSTTTKCCPSSDFKSCDKGLGCCPITSSCSNPKDLDTGDKCYGLFNDEARIPSK